VILGPILGESITQFEASGVWRLFVVVRC